MARMFPFATTSSRRWTGKIPLLTESILGNMSSGKRASASPFILVILPSRASESTGAAPRFAEFIALFPLHRLIARDNQLRDAVAFLNHVIARAQVEHHHADLAAIAGVDGPEVHRDRVLQRHAAAWPHLRFTAR